MVVIVDIHLDHDPEEPPDHGHRATVRAGTCLERTSGRQAGVRDLYGHEVGLGDLSRQVVRIRILGLFVRRMTLATPASG